MKLFVGEGSIIIHPTTISQSITGTFHSWVYTRQKWLSSSEARQTCSLLNTAPQALGPTYFCLLQPEQQFSALALYQNHLENFKNLSQDPPPINYNQSFWRWGLSSQQVRPCGSNMQLALGTTTLGRTAGTPQNRKLSGSEKEKLATKRNDNTMNLEVIYVWFSILACARS